MAFPSGVPRFALPTGIWLAAVPPSSEIVDIEIWWKSTSSTGFSWLTTMQQSGRLGGPAYSFVHDLPLTTESHTYKARSVANGKGPSTFTAEVTRRPVPLPQLAFGQQTPSEPVLGEELRVRVQGRAFHSNIYSTLIEYDETKLTLRTPTTGTIVCGASAALPNGARLSRVEARMYRPTPLAGLAGTIFVSANVVDQDGEYSAFGGILTGAGTTWATHTDLTLNGRKIADTETVSITATIGNTTSLTNADPKLAWVDLYYTSTSYKAVRGG